jgi:hypothetical protein
MHHEHGTLDVYVTVNKCRSDIPAIEVDLGPAIVIADANDAPIEHCDVTFMDLCAQNVHDPAVSEHEIGW